MNNFSYLLSFIEGILAFISPCILPMLPLYFFYLAGVSGEDNMNRKKLLTNSIGFVLGFTIAFVLLGATATLIGSFLKGHSELMRKISGIVMFIFGLNFLGLFKLNILNIEKRIDYHFKDLRFANSIIFGFVFGFAWTPCTEAFLASALLMASNSESLFKGILLLLCYSLGLGIPFILTAIIVDNVKSTFMKIQKFNKIIRIISGIVLLVAGILVFTDKLQFLSIW